MTKKDVLFYSDVSASENVFINLPWADRWDPVIGRDTIKRAAIASIRWANGVTLTAQRDDSSNGWWLSSAPLKVLPSELTLQNPLPFEVTPKNPSFAEVLEAVKAETEAGLPTDDEIVAAFEAQQRNEDEPQPIRIRGTAVPLDKMHAAWRRVLAMKVRTAEIEAHRRGQLPCQGDWLD